MSDIDIEEDFISNLSAVIGYRKKIGNNRQLNYSALLEYEHYFDFDDLDTVKLGGSAVYTIQPDPGYLSPWYDFDLEIGKLKFKESSPSLYCLSGWRFFQAAISRRNTRYGILR